MRFSTMWNAQSDQSLCQWLEYSMIVKLLTEHHLEFISLKGGCRGSSESTLVKLYEISCQGSYVIIPLNFTIPYFDPTFFSLSAHSRDTFHFSLNWHLGS